MRRAIRRFAPLVLLAVLIAPDRATAEEPELPRAWRWLAGAVATDGLYLSPLLEARERTQATAVSASVVALALAPPGARPEGVPIVGAGVLVRSDGLVASSWQVLSRASRTRWLWARDVRGHWMRAIPMGSTWWADVGLCRLVTVRRRFFPVRRGEATKQDIRRPFLAVGTGAGRALVAGVGRLASLELFDPSLPGGRRQVDRSWRRSPSEETPVIGLLYEDALAADGSAGSPVFDAESGVCVGLVSATEVADGRETRVLVRPWSYLELFLAHLQREVVFDPPDLGITWGPVPRRHGESAVLPADLEASRRVEPGGLLVRSVVPGGPSNRVLWEGDVVLEIEGRPVFGEVYESVALALMRLHPGVPTDLVVLRGGGRRALQVGTRRARELYLDFDDEHDRRAGLLPRAP